MVTVGSALKYNINNIILRYSLIPLIQVLKYYESRGIFGYR